MNHFNVISKTVITANRYRRFIFMNDKQSAVTSDQKFPIRKNFDHTPERLFAITEINKLSFKNSGSVNNNFVVPNKGIRAIERFGDGAYMSFKIKNIAVPIN